MDWTHRFYERQAAWSGLYRGPPEPHHQRPAQLLSRLAPPPRTVLELGAGGGQHAALTADAGYTVTAIELQPGSAANARALASARPGLSIIEGDFYRVALPEQHDLVCCWDGFGIGTDADQRRLLQRVRDWLAPDGRAVIDIYTPWYAARSAGHGHPVGAGHRRYGFDAEGCRWLDTWTDGRETVTQSLRCYSPADLRLLLDGTGLVLQDTLPGGGLDWETLRWSDQRPMAQAMAYAAVLTAG